MRSASTAAPETGKPEMSPYPADICLDHIQANNTVFSSFFDELKETGDRSVVAIQVTAQRLKPVHSGLQAGAYNGPHATVTLPRAPSARTLFEATYNNLYGFHLLAAVHKRVCDASKWRVCSIACTRPLPCRSISKRLFTVIDRYVVALAQTNGARL